MKRILIMAALMAAALSATNCARQTPIGPNDATKRYLDAWMQINNINVEPTDLGIYILEDKPGTGIAVEKDGLAFLDYTTYDLEGNIVNYTSDKVAMKLGEYDYNAYTSYYGPEFLSTYEGNIHAGIAEMIIGMKAGGQRKAIIPSWLFSYEEYDSESKYFEESTSGSTMIYDVTVRDFTTDIDKWEIDSIGRFFSNDKILIDGVPANQLFTNKDGLTMTKADSLKTGFYYKQLKAPVDTTSFAADTTIYINYTGRLLNGQVFDTTIEDVAKDNKIYSESKTYQPVQINWSDAETNNYSGITMGTDESTLIDGFSMTLWQMRPMEKGIGVFYSLIGYTSTGSGTTIPAYSPLIFEIEIVEAPEN